MRTRLVGPVRQELFSADEIAAAAGVGVAEVRALLRSGQVVAFRQFVAPAEAVTLVRRLSSGLPVAASERSPLTTVAGSKRRNGLSLATSGALHVCCILLIGLGTMLGLLTPNDTEERLQKATQPPRLVYLVAVGPGGGGGGGGLQMPAPPPQAALKPPTPPRHRLPPNPVVRMRRPLPPVRSTARLQRPIEPPRIEPSFVETPKPPPPPPTPQVVQAPVMPVAVDPVDRVGLPAAKPTAPSAGIGTGGGVGSGAGTGSGLGTGAGIGPGNDAGTGGGPFRPGTGIDPPVVVREVRPTYTEEGRRRAIEGDVVLEVVVFRDGRVGDVRILRSLNAGLDQKATEAIRQWRFNPARRQGTPVDVVVEVSVEFKLR